MFNKTVQRILKGIHISLITLWAGGLVSLIVLHNLAVRAHDGGQVFILLRGLFVIHEYVIMNAAVGVVLTGLLFSLFTEWGFFKFQWITVKWLSIVALFVTEVFYFEPAVNGMAALADVERAGALNDGAFLQYSRTFVVLSRVQLGALLLLVLLSVLKPWGQRAWQLEVERKKLVLAVGVISIAMIVSVVLSSAQLSGYRNMPISNVDLSRVNDGAYPGEADCGVPYTVKVTVRKHRITDITATSSHESKYARLGEGVLKRIAGSQKLEVDAITGATTSSKCLMKAVENAVKKGLRGK